MWYNMLSATCAPSLQYMGCVIYSLICFFCVLKVRHMVGSLLAVGAGGLRPKVIAEKLALGSSQMPGGTDTFWLAAWKSAFPASDAACNQMLFASL